MNNFLNIINNNTTKERLIKLGAFVLALFFVFYLYLVGSLIGAKAQEKHLLGILEKQTQKLDEVESLFMSEGRNFHLSFFKEMGYEEPLKFDLIKPTSNVAGIVQSSIHQ